MAGFWKGVQSKWHYWVIVVFLSSISLTLSIDNDYLIYVARIMPQLVGTFLGAVLIIALPYWIYYKLKKVKA